jgi:hypothetical protein
LTIPQVVVPPSIPFFSTSITDAPARAALIAAKQPALPPPTTKTSVDKFFISLLSFLKFGKRTLV